MSQYSQGLQSILDINWDFVLIIKIIKEAILTDIHIDIEEKSRKYHILSF